MRRSLALLALLALALALVAISGAPPAAAASSAPAPDSGVLLGHVRPWLLAAALGDTAVSTGGLCAEATHGVIPKRVIREIATRVTAAALPPAVIEEIASRARKVFTLPATLLEGDHLRLAVARTFSAMQRGPGPKRRDVLAMCHRAVDPTGAFVHRLPSRNLDIDH